MSSFRQGKLGNQPLWKSFLMGTDPCNDLVCPAEKREGGGVGAQSVCFANSSKTDWDAATLPWKESQTCDPEN